MSTNRISTGIDGLDELLEGGFIRGRTYLVAGEAGTGKTTFALQYLYNGALRHGEPGVYVTIDERPRHIIEDALAMGWDLERLMEENMLLVVEITPMFSETRRIDAERIVGELGRLVSEIGASRLSIDPIAPLVLRGKELVDPMMAQMIVREYIRKLIFSLDELGVTTVATSEIPTGTNKLSRYGVEEFLASGVIVLRLRRINNGFIREIYVRKMRGVAHSMDVHTFTMIRGRGIVIS